MPLTETRVRTVCRMCHGGCGVVVTLRDGRVVGLAGDSDNPNNTGFLCAKGRAAITHLYHPDRLTHPLRRTGPRGTGDFTRISWEEALALTAAELDRARRGGGAESVVFAQGTDRNYQEWLFRFANAFGSPNVLGPAHVCFYPRVMAGILTMGAFTFCDYEGDPEVVVLWGSNKTATHADGVIGTRLLAALNRGTRLIVIDPRRTGLAARADHWLQLRPGTDAALALGMLHVVIRSGCYDRAFVEEHTTGFAALAEHVAGYDPRTVAAITGVPAEQIVAAATRYARARCAAIELGTGAQHNRNSFATARAAILLSAICGNIDRPGGDVIWDPPGIIGRRALPMSEALPAEQAAKRLGGQRHRILAMPGWAHPGSVWSAVLDADPYPVRAMAVFGSNLLVSYADSERVNEALHRLDFLVAADLFLTPTAALADVVLPVSGWLERDQIVEHASYLAARRATVQIGECRSDEEILTGLAHRLGLGGFWPTAADSLDARLAPIGLTWSQLAERHYRATELRYHKYRERGFDTRTGKLALYGEGLRRFGYDPLPTYTPVDRGTGQYLLTSAHSPFFFNSEFRSLPPLRRREPDPVVEIHPDAAAREGIDNGDWVGLRVGDREVRMRVRVSDRVTPEVVCASAGWWYPEETGEESWRRSTLNLLTSNDDESPEMGSSNLRGVRCDLRRLPGAQRGAVMEDILARLAGSDLRSIGQANQVAADVIRHPDLFDQLIKGMTDPDPVIRMRASDAAEKVSARRPELLGRYRSRLLGEIAAVPQQEVRWHVAQMLPRLRLPPAERERAVSVLRGYLADHSRIVRVSAMQALADLATRHDELRPRVVPLLERLTQEGTPAMRARGRRLLARLAA